MKLIVDIEGEQKEVSVTRDGDRVIAMVSGREYELEASEPEPNVFLLKSGTRVVEFTVLDRPDGRMSVTTGDSGFDAAVIDPRKLGGGGASGGAADGVAEIRTQMPGKVVRILVAEGDEVSTGDGVIVVEAMKMQNEMRSPKDGVVREVRAAEGNTVNAGDVLVVID